jgi:hypothetical protein
MRRRRLQIAHPPLQWRIVIQRAAAAQGEAGIRDPYASGGDPDRTLHALGEQRFVSQRARQRMAPMARRLGLMVGPRCLEITFDAAKLILKR